MRALVVTVGGGGNLPPALGKGSAAVSELLADGHHRASAAALAADIRRRDGAATATATDLLEDLAGVRESGGIG
jgi:UDP:flavonoid glycosyltransferase YjiC (YdhE family)